MLQVTKTQVEQWQPWKLSEWATLIESQSQAFQDHLGRMRTHFTGLNGSWSGKAHDAAYDRMATEADQDRKLADEVGQLVTALRNADARISGERQALLGRVADAQAPYSLEGQSIIMTVTDQWQVTTTSTFSGKLSTDAVTKLQDEIRNRQTAINTAYFSFANAVTEANQTLDTDAGDIRAKGDLIGNGLESAPAGQLTGEQGKLDGETVADGKLSPEEIARIADNLGRAGLTPSQLDAMARGEEITVPASTMEYLTQFYDKAGRDGLIGVSEQLRTDNSEPSQRLRQELANGLLTVSNDKVVGRDPRTGKEDRGGWEKLNPEVREIIGTRPAFGKDTPDGNTRDLPDDYRPEWHNAKNRQGCLEDYLNDMSQFSDLLSNAGEGYEPGARFGVEMARQGAHQGYLLDNGGYGEWVKVYSGDAIGIRNMTEESAQNFLETGTRSKEASYALITGNGSPELFGKDTPGQTYNEYSFDKMIGPALGHQWSDDGAAIGNMFNWIQDDATSPDTLTATRAGESASALSRYIDSNKDWLMNMDGDRTASLGETNPRALRAFADALQPYIPNLAGVNPQHLTTDGFELPPEAVNDRSRAMAKGIFEVMNTDKDVAEEFNASALLSAMDLQEAWVDSVLANKPNNALADGYGAIHGIIDAGLTEEANDRTRDMAGQAANAHARKSEIWDAAKVALTTGIKYVPVVGPVAGDMAGNIASPAIDAANTAVKNATLGVYLAPDPASPQLTEGTSLSPGKQMYQLAQVLESRTGPIPHDPSYAGLFDASGKLKGYAELTDGTGMYDNDLRSQLQNILDSYRGGALSTPLQNFGIISQDAEMDAR
ncbi:hypothetical protein GV791_10510 [Nocardia cyriacigeorgica]|uniref:TPR repeat domain-containing protein n=1 Tax=Nocardia cyriacigeorgica TaxID=135487 RepID=A0A6P1CNP1_9NOCA|nr:hypothetical protein [Nocardia cyriacigeorgica]NEW32984.1 hypothetical protein [Nocardia cyriacigeorgica]